MSPNFLVMSFFVHGSLIPRHNLQENTVIGARYPNNVIWLVRDTNPYAAIWLVRGTYPNAAIRGQPLVSGLIRSVNVFYTQSLHCEPGARKPCPFYLEIRFFLILEETIRLHLISNLAPSIDIFFLLSLTLKGQFCSKILWTCL